MDVIIGARLSSKAGVAVDFYDRSGKVVEVKHVPLRGNDVLVEKMVAGVMGRLPKIWALKKPMEITLWQMPGSFTDTDLTQKMDELNERFAVFTNRRISFVIKPVSSYQELALESRVQSDHEWLREEYVLLNEEDIELINSGQMSKAAFEGRGMIGIGTNVIDHDLIGLVAMNMATSDDVVYTGLTDPVVSYAYGGSLSAQLSQEINSFTGKITVISERLALKRSTQTIAQKVIAELMVKTSA